MPNPKPNMKGLTRGKGKALKALGVEALAEGEVSYTLRVRTTEPVRDWLKGLGAKRIGELLERAYEEAQTNA